MVQPARGADLNVFLYDLRESTEHRHRTIDERRGNGKRGRDAAAADARVLVRDDGLDAGRRGRASAAVAAADDRLLLPAAARRRALGPSVERRAALSDLDQGRTGQARGQGRLLERRGRPVQGVAGLCGHALLRGGLRLRAWSRGARAVRSRRGSGWAAGHGHGDAPRRRARHRRRRRAACRRMGDAARSRPVGLKRRARAFHDGPRSARRASLRRANPRWRRGTGQAHRS